MYIYIHTYMFIYSGDERIYILYLYMYVEILGFIMFKFLLNYAGDENEIDIYLIFLHADFY